MHFKNVEFRLANNFNGRTIGFHDFGKDLVEKSFCSVECLREYILTKLSGQSSADKYFMPGEQVGADSPQGLVGK